MFQLWIYSVFFILEEVQKTKVDLYLTFVAHTSFIVDLRRIKGPESSSTDKPG